jgi:hypothetical protein
MQTVLVTGFEPFGGETLNPSWEVVKQLEGVTIENCRVVTRQLPCVFGESLTVLNAAIDELQPSVILAIGQAGGRVDITVERVAINVDDARIPDNRGQQPVDVEIVPGGPAAWFSSLPIKAMVSALREAGDFNAWSRPRMNALYRFAREMSLREVRFTDDQRRKAFGRPLDFVFYRGLNVHEASVLVTRASDHNPLLVEFSPGKPER